MLCNRHLARFGDGVGGFRQFRATVRIRKVHHRKMLKAFQLLSFIPRGIYVEIIRNSSNTQLDNLLRFDFYNL